MIRRVLVAMDGSPHGEAAAALAIDWSGRFDAELVGLGIVDEPGITSPEPVSIGGAAFKRRRDEVRLVEEHRRILELLAGFRRRCEALRLSCDVVEDVGTPHEQIVTHAYGCDVVVLGRETHFQFETQDHPDPTLGHVLRESPRPVVVVPRDPAPGEGVLVAYGTGREVARTLQVFTLLGLAADERVWLLAIDHDTSRAEARLRTAGRLLTAHSVRVSLEPITSRGAPAEVILEHVRRRRPRLIVMGAHGHHPVRDLFFTSVTRAVLKETPVPVLAGA